ncbi:MAG: creatininase family protein [Bacillota bacterium]
MTFHWRYEFMRPADLAEAIKNRPVAWLMLSPLEWHGEAMAFGCDPFVGQAILERAWKEAGGVLIPPLYLGTGTNYQVFEGNKGIVDYWEMETLTKEHNPGSLYVRPLTLELVLRDFLYFLRREGFRLCVVVSGHGAIEQVKVIREICGAFNNQHTPTMKVLTGWDAGGQTPPELRFEGSGGHADFSEASWLGGVNPEMVDIGKFGLAARDRKIGLEQANAAKIDFEKGRKFIEFRAMRIAGAVKEIIKNWGPGQ